LNPADRFALGWIWMNLGTESDGMIPRLYVDAPLAAGAAIPLDAARGHYLRNVLRREKGASVLLFNGRDGEWQAEIEALAKNGTRLSVQRQTVPQRRGHDLWLVFAPLKRERIDLLAEKATELGCRRLQPIFTQHTAVSRVNLERLAAHVMEAAEQTERLDLPEVAEPRRFGELLESWPADRRIILCAEAGAATPIAEALAGLPRPTADNEIPYAVMTGPEGGFASSELDHLRKLPFVTPVGLGPRVLRADTAAIAALACWQALLGDGRDRPPAR
jgi:16S rRNA (uracil1498-N3)-methyltransferase